MLMAFGNDIDGGDAEMRRAVAAGDMALARPEIRHAAEMKETVAARRYKLVQGEAARQHVMATKSNVDARHRPSNSLPPEQKEVV